MSGEGERPVAVFRPEVFNVSTFEQAKQIILTPESGTTSDERWEKETAFLVEDIGRFLQPSPESCILDYGCGVGRAAKALIERYGCRVLGVDFSPSMRLLAPEYVASERFSVCSAEALDKIVAGGFRAHAVIALWVIQHVFDPREVIGRIARALEPGALLYTLNGQTRCVPTNLGWANDGFDMQAGLLHEFDQVEQHPLPESATTPQLAAHSVIQIVRKRGR